MYFIKNCPYCTKALRFPIDRGKILVRCGCGHSFVADPDDPLLYRDGRFDLGAERAEKRKPGLFRAFGKDEAFINKEMVYIVSL